MRRVLAATRRRISPTWRRRVRTGLFASVGATLGLLIAAQVRADVGPFDCTVAARPSLRGATFVRLAPLGSIELDTHTAPIAIELRVDELRPEEAERIATDPEVLEGLEDELAVDVRAALQALALRGLVASIVGGALGGLAARGAWRNGITGAMVGTALAGTLATASIVTFTPRAVAEPRYTGLLTIAPRAVGDVQAVVERFDDYRAQLMDLVGNVVTLYRTAEGLPTLAAGDDAVRVLHVSDLHNNPQGFDLAAQLVQQFEVDAVIDTGDTTDWGTSSEARLLDRIGELGVPYVWVRGNHDSHGIQRVVASQPQAIVLDGDAADVAGLRIWGIGDPRYTPDKDQPGGVDVEVERIERFSRDVERSIGEADPARVDIVAVHDVRAAGRIGDRVPLILAGHTHSPTEERLDDALVLVEGSTGGAGLRGLQGDEPEPLACSILYFDPRTDRLVAYDRIAVDGLGGAGVRIERHVVHPDTDRGS